MPLGLYMRFLPNSPKFFNGDIRPTSDKNKNSEHKLSLSNPEQMDYHRRRYMDQDYSVMAWSLLGLGVALGWAGLVVPGLPGTLLIAVGAGLHAWLLPGWITSWTVIALVVLGFASMAVDFFGGVVGAKWAGATKAGLWGATLGAVIGILFMPVGLIVGPLLGALLGELIWAGRTLPYAGKAALGTLLGMAASWVARVAIAMVMTLWLMVDLLWN